MRWLIVPIPSGKPWTGTTVFTSSLGGSESAVAYLGFALQQLGEDVTVLSHGTTNPIKVCGVQYNPIDALPTIADGHWDVVIVSRWLNALREVQYGDAIKLFWSHDLPNEFLTAIPSDGVVFLTEFHAGTWRVQLDEPRVTLIGDGVDDKIFTPRGAVPKDENRLIWTSNPDRGLALAARVFQELRLRWPDLELHVFGRASVYGWDNAQEAPFLPRREDMDHVVIHESVPRAQLASELESSFAMLYPTFWPETFCMAALEAQAMGTPVICSPYGGLNETVKGGVLSYDFLNAFSQLRNKGRYEKLAHAGIEWAKQNTWAVQAQKWIDFANKIREMRNAN